MNITEFIAELEKVRDKHGEAEVRAENGMSEGYIITDFEFVSYRGGVASVVYLS